METILHVTDCKFNKPRNEEITKTDWRIDSYKIHGKLMAAEFPLVVLLLSSLN